MDNFTTYEVVPPSVALQSLIDSYYILEVNNQLTTSAKIFPTGTSGMVFQYGDRIRVTNKVLHNKVQPPVFLFGQMTSFAILKSTGYTKMLVVHFKPSGFYRLFKIPCYLFTDDGIDAEQVLGKSIFELLNLIAEAKSIHQKFRILDNYFLLKLKSIPLDSLIEESLDRIFQVDGRTSVTKLSTDLNVSRRTLERRFVEEVGLFPKSYSNIVKLSKILKILNDTSHISSTTLTYDYGFYDQSHFIHSFTSFCGETPVEYMSRVNKYNKEMVNISCRTRLFS